MTKPIIVSEKDWNRIGAELFGPNKLDWRFVCPACGHVSTGRRLLELDISDAGRVRRECEGRFNPSALEGCPKELRGGTKAKRLERLEQIAAFRKQHGCDWFGGMGVDTVFVMEGTGLSNVFCFDHLEAKAKLMAVQIP